jgi:multimeric flavodoxin WrbA
MSLAHLSDGTLSERWVDIMNIFAINGSPRKNKNTAILLKKALEGAASQNANTELIHLYNLKYKGCTSCFFCKRKDKKHGKCAMKDDLTPILERLNTAGAIVFGSPIYFMSITSGMAAFLERFLFSNIIYSAEIPTVYPRKISSGFIYTMNITREQADERDGAQLTPLAIGGLSPDTPGRRFRTDEHPRLHILLALPDPGWRAVQTVVRL